MPLLPGPFTTIGRDDFIGSSGNLDAHTPDCSPLPDCGIVGWEYGTSTDWQIEPPGSAVAQLTSVVFCRNIADIIPVGAAFRIYSINFRGGVALGDWLGGFHFFVDSVGAKGSLAANRSGVSYDIRANNPDIRLIRFDDSGVEQESIEVQGNFVHPASTSHIYGCDVTGDGVTVACWHATDEAEIAASGPTLFGDFMLGVNLRDSDHLRVGISAGAGGLSGRNFTGFIVLQRSGTIWSQSPVPDPSATVWSESPVPDPSPTVWTPSN